jgi:hypothetical protein
MGGGGDMRNAYSLATLAVCFAHCAAIIVILGFDRDGNWQFRQAVDWASFALMAMSPVVVLLAGGLASWRDRRLAGEWVVVAVPLSALVLYGVYVDHTDWRRTPPGRGEQPVGAVLATFLAWAAGLVLLAVLIVRRLLAARRRRHAEPGRHT